MRLKRDFREVSTAKPQELFEDITGVNQCGVIEACLTQFEMKLIEKNTLMV